MIYSADILFQFVVLIFIKTLCSLYCSFFKREPWCLKTYHDHLLPDLFCLPIVNIQPSKLMTHFVASWKTLLNTQNQSEHIIIGNSLAKFSLLLFTSHFIFCVNITMYYFNAGTLVAHKLCRLQADRSPLCTQNVFMSSTHLVELQNTIANDIYLEWIKI